MTTYVAHNMTRWTRINCDTEEAALFEIDRVEPDGPFVRPGDSWEVWRLTGEGAGTGKIIHHGVGPRTH